MSMKKWLLWVIGTLLLAVLVLSGCGNAATTTAAPTTSAPMATTAAPTTSVAPKTTTATATAVATTAPATAASTQKRGGILTVVTAGGPQVFGIPTQLGLDSQSVNCAIPAIQTLFNYDEKGQAQPVLAESWKVDPTARTITFNIRKGIKFHDGTDCDASAVAWNLDQFIQTKNAAADAWLSVAVLDPYTVMLKLVEYKATALAAFDSYAGMVVSPTAYKLNGADWAKTHPIGTGPFILKSFTRDSVTEFVKNPNYWEPGKPYLDGIKFVVIADSTTARLSFEAGQVDVLMAQAGDTANALKAKGNKVEGRPGTITTLVPDSKNATSPFSKKAVREAVEYAIDRPAIASNLGYGFQDPVNQAATPLQYGYNKDLVGRVYNPDKAKQLLKDAGYPNGVTITITTSSIYNSDPAVAMMNYLNAAGFKCTLNTLTQAAWTQASTTGWTNSLFYAPLATTDAEYVSFLDRYYSATSARYPVLLKPTEITDIVKSAVYEQDYAKRVSLAQQAVKLMQEDCTTISILHNPGLSVEKPFVMDAKFNAMAGLGFRWDCTNAWLNK
jgi:peptide/nickel transport system substrate-binding protein